MNLTEASNIEDEIHEEGIGMIIGFLRESILQLEQRIVDLEFETKNTEYVVYKLQDEMG